MGARLYSALGLAAVSALSACAGDSGGGIVIRQNLAAIDTTCSFTPDLTSPFLPRGTLALSSPAPYVLTPLIESRITALEGQESQRTILMRGARVDLRIEGATVDDLPVDLDTSSFPEGSMKFTSLFSGPVAPNGGVSAAEFDLIPTPFITAVRNALGDTGVQRVQVVAEMKVYGDLGGDEVESDAFQYPVTLCNNCVVNVIGACPAPDDVRVGNPCNVFQDGVVDCCTTDGGILCPAPVASN